MNCRAVPLLPNDAAAPPPRPARSRVCRTLAAFLAVLACGPTAAEIEISLDAQHDNAWGNSEDWNPSTTQAWGWVFATPQGANGVFGTGPAPCANIVCEPGPALPGHAHAIGRVDAGQMNLGVRAWGDSTHHQSVSSVEVEVTDTLSLPSFSTLVFDIHLDVAAFHVSANRGSEARYSFGIRLGSGDEATVPFALIAERTFTSLDVYETRVQVLLNNGNTVIDLPDLPSTFEQQVSIPTPPGLHRIDIHARAAAEADSGDAFVDVNAYDTAWLGIQGNFTSVNGYAYPGLVPIPEPGSALLMAIGLAAVGGRAWRVRGPWRRAGSQ